MLTAEYVKHVTSATANNSIYIVKIKCSCKVTKITYGILAIKVFVAGTGGSGGYRSMNRGPPSS